MDSVHVSKKVVLLGDAGVGKTSLIRRYVLDKFDDKYIAMIGTKVTKRDIEFKLPTKSIYLTMLIWDILGQREFRRVRSLSMKEASGVILVADLTNQESILGAVEFWYPQVQKFEGNVPAIVIGNKADMLPPDAPAISRLATVAGEISAPYFICSAKTGVNVEAAFKAIGEIVIGETPDPSNESEASLTLSGALDFIVHDFSEQYGDIEKGMEVVEKLVSKAKVKVGEPSKERSMELIELMSESEKDRLGREVSEVNKLRRWKILEGIIDTRL